MSSRFKRVRVNSCYIYDPVAIDRINAKFTLDRGSKVKVINQHGCPPANTMGHCYIGDPNDGKFIGMVCTNSLCSITEWKQVQREERAKQNDSHRTP